MEQCQINVNLVLIVENGFPYQWGHTRRIINKSGLIFRPLLFIILLENTYYYCLVNLREVMV